LQARLSIFRASRPQAIRGRIHFLLRASESRNFNGAPTFEARPMYAVIKTGGKQYRVQAGDLLVVEKLDGDVGAEVAFNDVLMLGEGADVIVGAPLVDGAVVNATLIETRKADKIKIFKKIRRQGYRRTKGHRQHETVLRVTSVAGQGKEIKWEGVVDLTTKAVLDARARNLTIAPKAALAAAEAPVAKAPAKKAAPKKAAAATTTEASAEAAPAKKAAPKAKAKPASDTEA
jgi:large subunit ribosomal protein L21